MSQELINALIYIGIFIFITGFSVLFIWLKSKFNLQQSDLQVIQLILQVVDYISSKTTISFKKGISTVIKYCFDALKFVENFENVKDIEEKKSLIKEKTLSICYENNILVDKEIILLVDLIIDYLISNKINLK